MKRCSCHLVPLAAASLLLVAGCGDRSGAGAWQKGLAQLRAGDARGAARSLRRATARVTDSAPLYYNLGTAYYRLGNLEGAAEAFQAAVELDPVDALALEHLGAVQLQRQQWEAARDAFTRALAGATAADPAARARILTSLAVAELGAGRADLACVRLLQARRIDFRCAPTAYNLASLYRDKFQLYAEAADLFELYVRLAPADDPHVAKARESLRQLRLSIGATTGGDTSRATRRDPAAAARAFQEGESLRAGRQWSRAAAAYSRALAADPLHYRAACNLGYTHAAAGDWREAQRAFARASEIDPGQVEPAYMQARQAYDGRDAALAAQILTAQVIPRWPAYAPAYELMALVRQAQQRLAEARVYGEVYVETAPPSAQRERFAAWLKTLPR